MPHNYLFDITLQASVRVEAETEADAKRKLAEAFDCASLPVEIGGRHVEFEASLDGDVFVVEIDGEAAPGSSPFFHQSLLR
jgi:hypothetical protein